jgi:hypothetical protein
MAKFRVTWEIFVLHALELSSQMQMVMRAKHVVQANMLIQTYTLVWIVPRINTRPTPQLTVKVVMRAMRLTCIKLDVKLVTWDSFLSLEILALLAQLVNNLPQIKINAIFVLVAMHPWRVENV